MKTENPFSELNLDTLQRFSRRLAQLYPAISRISIYDSALPEAAYVLFLEVQKEDPLEYQKVINDFCGSDPVSFRGIEGVPDCIRYSEDKWIVWVEDHGANLPKELVVKDSKKILYTCNSYFRDIDAFIKSLRVEVENDSEITIQEPGKSPIPYDYRQFGFKNNRVKAWKLLQETLSKKPHIIKLPRTTPRGKPNTREYGSAYKTLTRLNTKLIRFFRKTFGIEFPRGYKIYSPYKPGGAGSFVFKFKIPGVDAKADRYEEMPKERLVGTINSLLKAYSEAKDEGNESAANKILGDLEICLRIAKRKGYLTQEELKKYHSLMKDILTPHREDVKQVYEEDRDRYGCSSPPLEQEPSFF